MKTKKGITSSSSSTTSLRSIVIVSITILLIVVIVQYRQIQSFKSCFSSEESLLNCAFHTPIEHSVTSCITPPTAQSIDLYFSKLPNTLKKEQVLSDFSQLFHKHIKFETQTALNNPDNNQRVIVVSYASSRLKTEIRAAPIREVLNKYNQVLILYITLGTDCSHATEYIDDLSSINNELSSMGNVKVTVMVFNDETPDVTSRLLSCDVNTQSKNRIVNWINNR
jgi:hypothetical protein